MEGFYVLYEALSKVCSTLSNQRLWVLSLRYGYASSCLQLKALLEFTADRERFAKEKQGSYDGSGFCVQIQ